MASTPATRTNGQRGVCSTRDAAVAMMTISKVAQPKHCTTLSTVGSDEIRAPNRPRSSTIAGTPGARPGGGTEPQQQRADHRAHQHGEQGDPQRPAGQYDEAGRHRQQQADAEVAPQADQVAGAQRPGRRLVEGERRLRRRAA